MFPTVIDSRHSFWPKLNRFFQRVFQDNTFFRGSIYPKQGRLPKESKKPSRECITDDFSNKILAKMFSGWVKCPLASHINHSEVPTVHVWVSWHVHPHFARPFFARPYLVDWVLCIALSDPGLPESITRELWYTRAAIPPSNDCLVLPPPNMRAMISVNPRPKKQITEAGRGGVSTVRAKCVRAKNSRAKNGRAKCGRTVLINSIWRRGKPFFQA